MFGRLKCERSPRHVSRCKPKDGLMPFGDVAADAIVLPTMSTAPRCADDGVDEWRERGQWWSGKRRRGIERGPLVLFSCGRAQLVSRGNPCMVKPYPWG